jgi:hypothetical protein
MAGRSLTSRPTGNGESGWQLWPTLTATCFIWAAADRISPQLAKSKTSECPPKGAGSSLLHSRRAAELPPEVRSDARWRESEMGAKECVRDARTWEAHPVPLLGRDAQGARLASRQRSHRLSRLFRNVRRCDEVACRTSRVTRFVGAAVVITLVLTQGALRQLRPHVLGMNLRAQGLGAFLDDAADRAIPFL